MKKYVLACIFGLAPWLAFSANMPDLLEQSKTNPVEEFSRWQAAAKDYLDKDRQGDLLLLASLATIDKEGYPQQRQMYINAINSQGFIFSTHHDSAKVKQLELNHKASLLFLWPHGNTYLQVRVVGKLEELKSKAMDRTQQGVNEYALKPESIQFDRVSVSNDKITNSSLIYNHRMTNGDWVMTRASDVLPKVETSMPSAQDVKKK